MDDIAIEILKITASLIGGGAVGSVITLSVNAHRNRIQPVGRRIEVSPLFASSVSGSVLNPSITVSDGKTEHKFPNLYVADIQIVNRGNRDLAIFSFGMTLSQPDYAVHVEPYGLDRHHVVTLTKPVTLGSPSKVIDFALTPFNRGDSYTLKVFFVAGGPQPGNITLGSSEPVRFTEMPTLSETITSVARGMAMNFGPFQVLIRRS